METNAILAVNSLDRYITSANGQQNQPLANALETQYENGNPPNSGLPSCNNFSITSPGALIYGYISKIIVSDVQIQYNIPTVLAGLNDQLVFYYTYNLDQFIEVVTIPFGWYTPSELAAALQVLILSNDIGLIDSGFTVVYYYQKGFVFKSTLAPIVFDFFFPTVSQLRIIAGIRPNVNPINCLKMYRLIGFTIANSIPAPVSAPENVQISSTSVNFLYTPYIDIISVELTKYQKVKDTDTSAQKQSSMICRVYLAGQATPQYLTNGTFGNGSTDDILGSRPFTLTQSTPNAKIIRWSKDEAVNSIDFQLRDQYGDLIFTQYTYPGNPPLVYTFPTEFQMTLLCIEGEN